MMRCKLPFLLVFLPSLLWAQSMDDELEVRVEVRNQQRFTCRWAIVLDTSHSMQYAFQKARKAFNTVIQHPTDQLKFCMYVFNDAGVHRYLDWSDASQKAFDVAEMWSRQKRQTGICSYGGKAIAAALRQPLQNLTIIIISDGGFSEGFQEIESIIAEGQVWRVLNGYGKAIICAIGIENELGWRYPKDPDKQCQAFMKKIGTKGEGGYFLVRQKTQRLDTAKQRIQGYRR